MVPSALDNIMNATFEIGRYMRCSMLEAAKNGQKLNLLQVHALLLLQKHPGITMSEVAKHLKVTSPSASVFITRLVKVGWVRRLRDRKNRKLIHLHVTAAGEKMLSTMSAHRKEAQKKMLAVLSSADQESLARILSRIVSALPKNPSRSTH